MSETNDKPKRIQRERTRGWRMPENTVYVGRPTKWGNPFTVKQFGLQNSIRYYRAVMRNWAIEWSQEALNVEWGNFNPTADLSELRGKDLACWCPLDQSCHADVLLELANQESES